MRKIEVDAMTALVDAVDMSEERGSLTGWGWTHWDGPDRGDCELYRVYMLNDPEKVFEIWVDGKLHTSLEHGVDFQIWAIKHGWRPVISYTSKGGIVGYDPRPRLD